MSAGLGTPITHVPGLEFVLVNHPCKQLFRTTATLHVFEMRIKGEWARITSAVLFPASQRSDYTWQQVHP